MKEILIVTDLFEKSKTLSDFFITKSTSTKLLNSNDLNKFESPKSTLICSLQFEKKIGGQSNLLKISREIGCTNLIVLNTTDSPYNIESELGGAYLKISFNEINQVIKEIIFQIISLEKYSFSDKKTHGLINMARKVA